MGVFELKYLMEGRVPKLDQDPMFIKDMVPADYTSTMGQYALTINYTNGDKQVLTTPIPPHMGNDKGDFDSFTDLKTFYNFYKTK